MGASEVFKNQSFKSQFFQLLRKENMYFNALIVFINKIKNLRQFSEKNSHKWALIHVV